MSKIFGLHSIQEKLVQKYCFDECGKILVGGLDVEGFGCLFPCREKNCPFEEKRLKLDGYEDNSGNEIWLRKLKEADEK